MITTQKMYRQSIMEDLLLHEMACAEKVDLYKSRKHLTSKTAKMNNEDTLPDYGSIAVGNGFRFRKIGSGMLCSTAGESASNALSS